MTRAIKRRNAVSDCSNVLYREGHVSLPTLSVYQWAALLIAPVFALLWLRDRQVLKVKNGLTGY